MPIVLRRPKPLWAWVFAVAVAVHLVVLYVPRAPSMNGPRFTDKVIHLLVFAVPVFVGLLAALPVRWVVVGFALHAPVSELVQYAALPNRSGDIWDAMVDLAGVALGVLGVLVFTGRRHRSEPPGDQRRRV